MLFYHISFNGKLEGIWTPRAPAGMTHNSNAKASLPDSMSEPDFPRICLAPDIRGCWEGVYPNVSILAKNSRAKRGMSFYVYSAEIDVNDPNFRDNDFIVNKRYVWDAHRTKEVWYLDKLQMNLDSEIKIYPNQDKEIYIYPFNDHRNKKRLSAVEMEYEVVKRYGGFYKRV